MRRNRETIRRPAALALVVATLVPAAVAVAHVRHGGGGRGGAVEACLGRPATILGTARPDTLSGTPGRDVISGRGGADRILGRGGDDLICGGPGADRLNGGRGDDRCEGGAGRNRFAGCEIRGGGRRAGRPAHNHPPVLPAVSASTDEDTPVAVDLLSAAADPDQDAIALASVDDSGAAGRARAIDGRTASFDPAGRLDRLAAGESASTGFGYTVADDRGGSASATVAVTVTGVDDSPVAVADATTFEEDAFPTPVDVLANDEDPDGGPLAIESATDPAHGTVTLTGAGSGLTYRPDPDYCGEEGGADSFTYTLNGGSSAAVDVAIECAHSDQEAVDDAAAVLEDSSAATIDVLANDDDIDGGFLSIASTTQPVHGTVEITGGGAALRYTPDPDYCGEDGTPDSFEYTLNGGASASVRVVVLCVDDSPLAIGDSATLVEDAPATPIDVLANDEDPDGGPLAIESATDPAHGTVTPTGAGSGLTYRPDPDYCGEEGGADSFTYTLNGGSSADVSVLTECVNQVTADPPLFPAFDSSVSDYTVRCADKPISLTAETKAGSTVAVDGAEPDSGLFHASVPLLAGQEFGFIVNEGGEQLEYHVRCVPADFPLWTYEQQQPSRHDFYLVAPTLTGGSPYAVIFDRHGAPVWWYRDPPTLNDAKFLPGGRLAWWSEGSTPSEDAYEIRELDGTLVSSVRTVTGATDWHDFQESPNGNYMLISHQPREHVDLSAYGGGQNETVIDGVVEEVTPTGRLLWSWNTNGHVGLDEVGRWWPAVLAGSGQVRISHLNSLEPAGDEAFLISLRHTDAVYKVDKATGMVLWKLGGTETPQSLTVLDDPRGFNPLGGPHDVRLLPDGTITVHDNRTGLASPPRAVRYKIDEAARTATMIEQVTDPEAPSSNCCGSARRAADKSWLVSWGGRSQVTEFDPLGRRTFKLGFGGAAISYRAVWVPDGVLSAAVLRAGMDSMHPR
jgi:VCBS repeat-containing protein